MSQPIQPPKQSEVLQQTFLLARAKILEVAAILDRLDHAADAASVKPNAQHEKLNQAISLLANFEHQQQSGALRNERSRAAAIQMLFSLPFDPDWQTQFQIASSANATKK